MNPVEIVFWFDTTGSMSPCLGQVRKRVEDVFAPLFKEMPDLKIGLGANGDYCDMNYTYVTATKELTKDLYSLTKFVREVPATGGGDLPECYELVLNVAQDYAWTPEAKKIFVLIADDVPHGPAYPQNTLKLDWKKEAEKLRNKDITVYAVQALGKGYASNFYATIANITDGYHLKLDQFSEVLELIRAVTYRQQGVERVEAWEQELTKAKRMTRSMEDTYLTLTGKKKTTKSRFATSTVSTGGGDAVPVDLGRFQVFDVDNDCVIKSFVEDNGLTFKAGRGFYEFTKTEEVQEKKEVVVRDKVTGDMFSGDKARWLIGVPPGTRVKNAKPTNRDKYDVWIQSTSYNRKLKGGTRFLYEVDMTR